jgi:transcription initiation factor TFIIIB Brf1 subunit/transcription initiation factor TFIIB
MERRTIGIDDVAAHNLLIALGVKLTASNLAAVARHLKAHRESAEQAEESMLQHLEAVFMENDKLQKGDRASGYAAAQQEAMNWFFDNAVQHTEVPRASKGRMLRSMVRERKQRSAIITRRQT